MTQNPTRRRSRPDGGGRRAAPRRGRSPLRWVVLLLVAVLLGGLLVWALLQPGSKDSADQSSAPKVQPVTAISATMLPPIVQRGARPSSADKAGALVQVDAKVKASGGEVTLQVRRDGDWAAVESTPLDKDARATFSTPADVRPRQEMRVVAGDGAVASSPFTSKGWKLGFDDEFTGFDLDQTKWNYRQLGIQSGDSGRSKSESSADAVAVENGALKLSTLQNPASPGSYLNGHVGTENTYSFTYGVSAARIKFQKPSGMHGSFWMQSPIFGSVPGDAKASGTEIDTVEYFGSEYQQGGLASFTYYLDQASQKVKTGGMVPQASQALAHDDAWWKKYHVFSVEWTPEHYVFRVDGVETLRMTTGISGVPEFLVLSLLSSDWELKDLDESTLPATMKVDWVRVWQPKA
jgi:beta-glucanase (GH16 family)